MNSQEYIGILENNLMSFSRKKIIKKIGFFNKKILVCINCVIFCIL